MGEETKISWLREELYLPDEVIALNAGSWGPLCRAAREAIMKGYMNEAGSRGEDPVVMRKTQESKVKKRKKKRAEKTVSGPEHE